MSSSKQTTDSRQEAAAGDDLAQNVELPIEKEPGRKPDVEVTSLEVVADDEAGCDPYNSTGQFCLEELRKFDK